MRPVFVFVILATVLMVGLPFGPADEAYFLTRNLGLDVSMAPITVDTSMMTDETGRSSYDKKLWLKLRGDVSTVTLKTTELDFYLHKIPLHHYYEFVSYRRDMSEGRRFLCSSFQRFMMNDRIRSFALVTNQPEDKGMGFNEFQNCP